MPYLREEAPGAASGMEHPLDEEGTELLAGQRPAPHPVAGLPGRPAQQVRLPGLLCWGSRDVSGSGPGTASGEGQGIMSGDVRGERCAGRVVSPTLVGMGCCMQGCKGSPPDPPNPQLLPRRGPWTQCKGDERRVTATSMSAQPGLALTRGRAGSPNNHRPPPTAMAAPTPALSPEGAWVHSLGFHVPSQALPRARLPQTSHCPHSSPCPTPRPGGSDAARASLSLSLPTTCPKGCVSKGMSPWTDTCPDGHMPWPQPQPTGWRWGAPSGRVWPAQRVPGVSSPLLTQLPVGHFCISSLAGGCSSPGA